VAEAGVKNRGTSRRRGTTNVYADLGYPAPETMLKKAQLVSRIGEIMAERGLSRSQAASALGIPQPKRSKILRGQFRGFSERKLIDCLTQLGQARRL
jgi:predicted XRE-type DNA-binding protein